jgi:hypothetical protein
VVLEVEQDLQELAVVQVAEVVLQLRGKLEELELLVRVITVVREAALTPETVAVAVVVEPAVLAVMAQILLHQLEELAVLVLILMQLGRKPSV